FFPVLLGYAQNAETRVSAVYRWRSGQFQPKAKNCRGGSRTLPRTPADPPAERHATAADLRRIARYLTTAFMPLRERLSCNWLPLTRIRDHLVEDHRAVPWPVRQYARP